MDKELGRELNELIGAIGLYLGLLESDHEDNKDRLHRSYTKAIESKSFDDYMKKVDDEETQR